MWTKQGKTDHRKKVHVAGAMESSGRGVLWWRGLASPSRRSLVHSLGGRGGTGSPQMGSGVSGDLLTWSPPSP